MPPSPQTGNRLENMKGSDMTCVKLQPSILVQQIDPLVFCVCLRLIYVIPVIKKSCLSWDYFTYRQLVNIDLKKEMKSLIDFIAEESGRHSQSY